MTAPSIARLEVLDRSSPRTFTPPTKRIHESSDVPRFLTSLAYRDIGVFILQLTHAVCPRNRPDSPVPLTFSLSSKAETSSPAVQALQTLLGHIEKIIEEAPPAPGPRRFGNMSFRKWYELLEGRIEGLLHEGPLGETLNAWDGGARKEAQSYLLGGFGSAQRLDYGTGHELSFLAFVGCLWKLGHFSDSNPPEEIERQIVFQVVEPYLHLVRKLITTYTLEPAGSHGVWGLDDHSFAPYIFGSAQFTRPINDTDPMPTEGSVRGAPKPGNITKAVVVDDYRQTNMYFSAIGFINDIKTGPFWEHSPMLFDISGIRDGWGKINKGMIKMYNAEVLSKFPVVQHFPFGSLFSWDADPNAAAPPAQSSNTTTATATSTAPAPPQPSAGTAAPWAASSRAPPTMSGTAAPWAQSSRTPSNIPTTRMPPPPPSASQGRSGDVPSTKAPWAK